MDAIATHPILAGVLLGLLWFVAPRAWRLARALLTAKVIIRLRVRP